MDKQKSIFLTLAVVTALLLASIGIFIAEQSAAGILGAVCGVLITMGTGFRLKKKWNRSN